ncbi:MAG: SDR family oxidoreductase [Hyphomicrobiaceae bacterium]|nr:SDR family oxidoreductase [Hyphomicrobiaceae bacterium]
MAQREGPVLVTGAGRGIGAAISRALAAQGRTVAINYRENESAARTLVEEITANGGNAKAYKADIAREGEVVALFEKIHSDFGVISGLVNNAGISGGFSRVEDVTGDILKQVFAVNVIGAFLCAREAVKLMSTSHGGQGGVIINISSRAAALGGSGEWVHYAASKGALDTLTIGLAKEVAAEGIRVNAVAAGFVETEMHAAAGKPDRARELAANVPLGRPAHPDEIAQAVCWLMSPAASYVTGSSLSVSGGR